jgi:mRNA interferase RelE/StbE
MENYKIEIKPTAGKELERLPSKDKLRVIKRIRDLARDTRPAGCKKLSGQEKYRVKQGNYRILYTICDEVITVVVVRIAHRRVAYG